MNMESIQSCTHLSSVAWMACLAAYLMGSLSFAVLVSKAFGLEDPRTFGSKNPGATNVLRTGNKAAAALTLFMDAFKGWLPVFCFSVWMQQDEQLQSCSAELMQTVGSNALVLGLVALSAFLGHLFPIFFRFKGGKGVATAFGVLLGIEPVLGIMTLLCWVLAAKIWRYSSLSALLAAIFAPLGYVLLSLPRGAIDWGLFGCIAFMSALLLYRHKTNLWRLFHGEEDKIGAKKPS